MLFIASHIVRLIIFAVAIGFAGMAVSKLRNTSATYTARLLPFAYFSLSSSVLGALQYVILISSTLPDDFRLSTGLWLALMQNVFLAAAVLSLHSKQFSRIFQTLPIFIVFPIVLALAFPTYRISVLTSELFTYIDAVAAATIFMVLGISIVQLRLSKISAAAFLIHGYSQWAWRWLWLTPLGMTNIAQFTFPLWRIALLIAWTRLISKMAQRAQPWSQKLSSGIERREQRKLLAPLNVMISSTVEDLVQEREAADRAIRGLDLIRFRAERFGVADSPKPISALLAEQCDIFVLIIGEHYGYIIRSEGISVVEFEYEVARAQNPEKILVYVKDSVNREPRLEEFLKRVQDSENAYFRSSFNTPEDLYEKIQRDIARWLTSQVEQKQI